MNENKSAFLRAEWRKLLMLNYEISPEHLAPFVPKGTELDFHEGKTFVSMVGFMFLKTKVLGLKVPFHTNFEEVNLRFYVKREHEGELRRGVVFIRELVPKPAISLVANSIYNEKYSSLPMKHGIEEKQSEISVSYSWRVAGRWNYMSATADSELLKLEEGMHETFIAEHYWGYSGNSKASREYRVEHPTWDIYKVKEQELFCPDAEKLYGTAFAEAIHKTPASAFLAEGSEIIVRQAGRVKI